MPPCRATRAGEPLRIGPGTSENVSPSCTEGHVIPKVPLITPSGGQAVNHFRKFRESLPSGIGFHIRCSSGQLGSNMLLRETAQQFSGRTLVGAQSPRILDIFLRRIRKHGNAQVQKDTPGPLFADGVQHWWLTKPSAPNLVGFWRTAMLNPGGGSPAALVFHADDTARCISESRSSCQKCSLARSP